MSKSINKVYKKLYITNTIASNAFARMCSVISNVQTLLYSKYLLGIVNGKIDCIMKEPDDEESVLSNSPSGAVVGDSNSACRIDHVHPSDTSKIDTDSPTINRLSSNVARNVTIETYDVANTYATTAIVGSLLIINIEVDNVTVNVSLPTNAIEGSIAEVSVKMSISKDESSNRYAYANIDAGYIGGSQVSIHSFDSCLFMRVRYNNVLKWVLI